MHKRLHLSFPLALVLGLTLSCHSSSRSGKASDPGETRPPNSADGSDPSQHANDNREAAQYRGYGQINRILNQRFFLNEGVVSLDRYLDGGTSRNPLSDLLGTYNEDGLHTGMKNGNPNAVSMLLWYIALDGFTRDLAGTSGPAAKPMFDPSELRPDVKETLNRLAAWPSVEARQEENLKALWNIAMQGDASQSEYEAWRDFILSPEFTQQSSEALQAMLTSILYNPQFLLQR